MNKISAILSAVISMVIVSAVLVPTVAESTNDHATNGYGWNMGYYTDDLTHTISGTASTINIDDAQYDIASQEYVAFSDAFFVYRVTSNYVVVDSTANAIKTSSTFTINIDEGIAEITAGDYTATVTCSWIYLPSPDGEYVTADTADVKLNNTSQITMHLNVTGEGNYTYVHNDELYRGATLQGDSPLTTTVDSNGFINVIGTSVHSLDSKCIVPKEVTVHKPGAEYALIGIIPVLVLAGLIIGVVGTFIRARD